MKNSSSQKTVAMFVSSMFLVIFLASCNAGTDNVAPDSTNVVNPDGTKAVVETQANGTTVDKSTASLEITNSTQVNGVSQASTPAASDEVQKLLANQDKLNSLVKAGDVSKCVTLEMAQYKVSCEANILANKAKSKTDKAVCKDASTPEAMTQCESVVSLK